MQLCMCPIGVRAGDALRLPSLDIADSCPQNGDDRIVELLLKAGADRDKARNTGSTPLYMASQVCVLSACPWPRQ